MVVSGCEWLCVVVCGCVWLSSTVYNNVCIGIKLSNAGHDMKNIKII